MQAFGLLLAVPVLVLVVPQIAIQSWEMSGSPMFWLQQVCRLLAVVSLGAGLWTFVGWREERKEYLVWKRAL
jgi:hypothetical protein